MSDAELAIPSFRVRRRSDLRIEHLVVLRQAAADIVRLGSIRNRTPDMDAELRQALEDLAEIGTTTPRRLIQQLSVESLIAVGEEIEKELT